MTHHETGTPFTCRPGIVKPFLEGLFVVFPDATWTIYLEYWTMVDGKECWVIDLEDTERLNTKLAQMELIQLT